MLVLYIQYVLVAVAAVVEEETPLELVVCLLAVVVQVAVAAQQLVLVKLQLLDRLLWAQAVAAVQVILQVPQQMEQLVEIPHLEL
jgi:hypothetical protein